MHRYTPLATHKTFLWLSGKRIQLPIQEMQETQVRSLDQEDPLEEGMATHSNILAWRIPRDRGAWQATVHWVTKSWTRLSDYTHTQHSPLLI